MRGRLLLADHQALVVAGLRLLLGPHHDVIAVVDDCRRLVPAVLEAKPDMSLVEAAMPLFDGI
jgi:DNA-binding NarL/FixJ family response regulator